MLKPRRRTLQRAPLSESEKAVNLESGQLSGDARLQQAFDNSPPVSFGATGPHVAKIQQGLLDCGFVMPRSTGGGTKPPDGIFGEETFNVLKGFQLHQGVDRDGVAGRQTLGELDGRLTGRKPPGSGPSGPAPPASAVSVSPVDVVPLTFLECGQFIRKFDWETNAVNGYLIQEVRSSRSRQDCQGVDLGDDTVSNRYWEAWRVQEDGTVHPRFDGVHDTWARSASEGRGSWTLTGDVFFVEQLDPAAGFSPLSGTEAGALNATTTRPSNLGTSIFTHSAAGRWDCCGPVKTHVPVNGGDEGTDKVPAKEAGSVPGLLADFGSIG